MRSLLFTAIKLGWAVLMTRLKIRMQLNQARHNCTGRRRFGPDSRSLFRSNSCLAC